MQARVITRNTLTVLAMTSGAFAGAPASVDSPPQPTMTRHQLVAKTIECMRKLMSKDATVSYNEAAKTCRHQISRQSDKSAPGSPVASGTR
jgi:hypothetical protein